MAKNNNFFILFFILLFGILFFIGADVKSVNKQIIKLENQFENLNPEIKMDEDFWKSVQRPIFPSHVNFNFDYMERGELKIEDVTCNKIEGVSMYPSVNAGNMICYKLFKDKEAEPGDMVVYKPTTVLRKGYTERADTIFHRITGKYSLEDGTYRYVIMSDFPFNNEETVYSEDIIGIVVAVLYT